MEYPLESVPFSAPRPIPPLSCCPPSIGGMRFQTFWAEFHWNVFPVNLSRSDRTSDVSGPNTRDHVAIPDKCGPEL